MVATVALSPWPSSTATVALAAATAKLRAAIGEPDVAVVQRLGAVASAIVEAYAPGAPQALKDEAVVRTAGRLAEMPSASVRSEGTGDVETGYAPSMTGALLHSGSKSLLYPYRRKRAGVAK